MLELLLMSDLLFFVLFMFRKSHRREVNYHALHPSLCLNMGHGYVKVDVNGTSRKL